MKRSILLEVADLLLKSEESTADWAEVPTLRRLWYLLCGLITAWVVLIYSWTSIFSNFVHNSTEYTYVYRLFALVLCIFIMCSVIALSINYYKYVITSCIKIKLINILYFYLLSVILFCYIYINMWLMAPNFFNYNNPAVQHSFLIIDNYFDLFKLRNDFLLFSGMHSVNGSFYNISFNSIYPALIGWIQSIYTLGLLVLLIASYVNQNTNIIRKEI